MLSLVLRAALFALTEVAFFAYWVVARPSYERTASMSEWPHVLGFSAILLLLAVALPPFGRMVGGRSAFRWSLLAGSGVALSSLANVIEDGLRLDWAFFFFVLGSLITLVALVALTIVIALPGRGRYRLLASIPVGTMAGLFLFVIAGGFIMLLTWLAAAGMALPRSTRETDPKVTVTTP